jgi:hypothetical protein
MRVRRKLRAALALVLTIVSTPDLVAPAPVSATELGSIGRSERDRDLSSATDRIGDPVFDAADARGDVTSASLTAAGDGDITAVMTVRTYGDPLGDTNWLVNMSSPAWHLDVDGDGRMDFWAAVWQQNGSVVGGVFDRTNAIVCGAQASAVAAESSYVVLFDRLCIGSPATLRWKAVMSYDVGSRVFYDSAPDTGWSGPVRDAPPAPADPDSMASIVPVRLLDTRAAGVTIDGQSRGIGRRAAGSVTELIVAGRGGVPTSAAAVMLNVTAVDPSADGYITVWPCDEQRPVASHVNYRAGAVAPNAVLAKVGRDGTVCLATLAATDVLVDVSAFVPNGASPSSLVPSRLFDSRNRPGDDSPDGDDDVDVDVDAVPGRRVAGSVTSLRVAGQGGVPSDAEAVLLNVTAVQPSSAGFLTVWPCGTPQPVASSVNFETGEIVPNAVLAKVGSDGSVCIATSSEVDLVVDVNGFVRDGGSLVSLAPARMLETRGPEAGATIDGVASNLGRLVERSVNEVRIAGRGGVPADADAVMLNVTAVQAQNDGYLTVWPCGSPQPVASNVNYRAGQVVPNAVLTKLGPGGTVCIYTHAATDVVIDVNGYV